MICSGNVRSLVENHHGGTNLMEELVRLRQLADIVEVFQVCDLPLQVMKVPQSVNHGNTNLLSRRQLSADSLKLIDRQLLIIYC